MAQPLLSEAVREKWNDIIEADGVAPITDKNVRNTTLLTLENTEKASLEEGTTTASGFGTGVTQGTFDPVLISMVRRTMPSLIAHDLVGVQPMTGPTGLIFAMKAHYTGNPQTGAEAFGTTAPDANFTGNGTGGPDTTANGEILGTGSQVDATSVSTTEPVTQTNPWPEMSFEISKLGVEAGTRALKAKYTMELAQDLKAIHGMDAESELANILSTEVVGEINRELVALIDSQAVVGAQGAAVAGTFNLGAAGDADGRWEMEKYKNLYMQIVREAALVAVGTRRGVGNTLIVSPLVAAALESVAKLSPATSNNGVGGNVSSDFLGVTYVGTLGGRFKLFVDPYAVTDFVIVGYKGASVYDAGIYYCPYVPLQMVKARGEEDFQPRLGMKTRYATATNPFVPGTAGTNEYYRKFTVTGI